MTTITYREYWDEIRSLAEGIIKEIEDGNAHYAYVWDTINQRVDGHQWIINYRYNNEILARADNPDAWEDFLLNESIESLVTDLGMDHAIMVQAFYAMSEDVGRIVYQLADGEEIDL